MNALLGDFHFLRPLWLVALLALPLLWYALRRGDGDAQAWRGAVDAHLLRHLLERDEGSRGHAPHWLLGVAWVLACIALAGPAWERLPQPLFQNRAARVIALELAPSMLSQDVKPSRVERARYKISDILRRSGDAQTALIAYADDAFVVAPLTDDSNTVQNLVDALDPSIMPAPGNSTARAIELGARLVSQAGLREGELVLVADSVSSDAAAAAAKARTAGVRVSVLGIGTEQGAPVAATGGGFLKDSAGNIAMPRLDAATLAAVATAGGGRYATYSTDARDLDALLDDLRPSAADEAVAANAQAARFLDRGPWLLVLLVPLAGFGFRRGWLMLVPLALMLQAPRAEAMTWTDLWSRADQQAQAALDAGDAKQAESLAHDPRLRGSAAYRAEDYAGAAQDFDRPDAEAQYNLGNALAKQGKFPEAIAAYDRALKQQPDMDDALANRKAVEDWLKKQKQNQNGKSGNQGNSEHNDQRQSGENGADQESQDEQQQRGDRENGEQRDGNDQHGQNRQAPDQQNGQQQEGQQDSQSGESQGQKNASPSKSNADNDKSNPGKAAAQPESQAAEQRAQQQFQQSMDQALKNAEAKEKKSVRLGAREDGAKHDEKQQAVEQWLQRVPDDPGGLLRRKFQLENQRRQQGGDSGGEP